MKRYFPLITVALLLFVTFLFADASIVVPDGDPLAALLSLVTNWSSLSPLAIASLSVVIATQALKKFMPTFQYMRAAVTILGVVWGVMQAMIGGQTFLNSVAFALLTSGGAVAIYELFKNPLNNLVGVVKDE